MIPVEKQIQLAKNMYEQLQNTELKYYQTL